MSTGPQATPSIASKTSQESWTLLGKKIVKSEGVFFSQIIIIYITVITCMINLTLNNGNSNFWTALLSSSLGYLLPNPKIKKHG
jgi:hypothetical protein